MKFSEIRVGEDTYVVSEEWLQSLQGLIAQASLSTLREYPGAEIMVDVYLTRIGPAAKIAAIKEVRLLRGLNLRESKDLVDLVEQGKRQLLGRYTYSEAERICRRFREEAGATVTYPSPLELLGEQAE